MEYKVAPSLLAADFTRLGEQVHEIEEAGAPYLHLDVMDGAFVPSISFGMPVLKSLRKVTNMTFDVHMMVEEPGRYQSPHSLFIPSPVSNLGRIAQQQSVDPAFIGIDRTERQRVIVVGDDSNRIHGSIAYNSPSFTVIRLGRTTAQ